MPKESTDSPAVEADTLAALAHPLRRRIIDALAARGPATVSMLADQLDQRVGNVSHHVRVLATAGIVEEDTERARDRREHWWRSAGRRISFGSATEADSPSIAAITTAAEMVNLDQHVGKITAWMREREGQPEWSAAAFATDAWVTVSPDELDTLGAEINDVIVRWARRSVPDDEADRRPVFVFAHGVPARP